MVTIWEALEASGAPAAPLVLTGLHDLDSLLGGVPAGDLWLLSAAPRHGRTTLASMLASRAARSGVPTSFLVGVDGVADAAARLLSSAGRISLQELRRGTPPTLPHDQAVVDEARSWSVHLVSAADSSVRRVLGEAPPRSFLVIDDLDRWVDDSLEAVKEIKAWALTNAGAAVLTLPRGIATPADPAWQSWVRATDVVIDLEMLDGDRLGEVDLTVLHNRRGPTMVSTVAAAFFYSSLLDRPLTGPHSRVPISERIQDVGTPAWGSTEDWDSP